MDRLCDRGESQISPRDAAKLSEASTVSRGDRGLLRAKWSVTSSASWRVA